MIPMHPYLISQLVADRQADRTADAARQNLARQARDARRAVDSTTDRTRRERLSRPLRLAPWLRAQAPV
jgi:hypothetical protein